MDVAQLEQIARLRIVVGYLGERDHYAWWQSSFFAPGSRAFLQPVFGRTQLVAQCNGVTHAAAVVHDERIGVGNVYHLFRLPEDIEQALHRVLHEQALGQRLAAACASKDAALDCLADEASTPEGTGIGPVRVGAAGDLRHPAAWHVVAAQYRRAYVQGIEVYPYFADKT